MPEVTDELIGEVIAGSRRVFMPHSLGSYQNIPSTPLEIELALEVRRLRESEAAARENYRQAVVVIEALNAKIATLSLGSAGDRW